MQLHGVFPDYEYFKSCARIRKISMQALLRRVMEAIAEDHLIGSILDDEGQMRTRRKGERGYRRSSDEKAQRQAEIQARAPKAKAYPRARNRAKADAQAAAE